MATKADIEEKRGDTRTRELFLNGDLTGHTAIKFLIQKRKDSEVIEMTPEVLDASTGHIEIKFDGTLAVGWYEYCEVQVDWPDERATFPNDDYLTLEILRDVGD